MRSSTFACVQLLALAAALAEAQSQCDGTPIPQAQGMSARYPKYGAPATILPGDNEAQQLYQAILAENRPALNFAPHTMTAGRFNVSYDYGSDTECWWSATTCKTPKDPQLPPDYSFCPSPATWGLSIDDGPTCAHGPLYDLLQQKNQLATVYYIGVNVLAHPAEAQRGFTDGHEVCVHTWSHPYMTTLTNEEVFAELYYTKKASVALLCQCGLTDPLFHQNQGSRWLFTQMLATALWDVDDRVRTFAQALDMRTHLWTADTDDWQVSTLGNATVEANYKKIIGGDYSSAGIIVLTHELNEDTVALLDEHYPIIQQNFAHIAPVSTCYNNTEIFAEYWAPSFVQFSAYVDGQRGDARDNSSFWSNDPVVYIGNGTAATLEPAPQSSSSSMQLSAMPSSASAPMTTYSPSVPAAPQTTVGSVYNKNVQVESSSASSLIVVGSSALGSLLTAAIILL